MKWLWIRIFLLRNFTNLLKKPIRTELDKFILFGRLLKNCIPMSMRIRLSGLDLENSGSTKVKIAEKAGTSLLGPADALLGQTSRGGYFVFQQEIVKLEEDEAIKLFNACPHVEALAEMGLDREEIRMFCRDMLIACDYGIIEALEGVEISFPTTVADGEGEPCTMIIKRSP